MSDQDPADGAHLSVGASPTAPHDALGHPDRTRLVVDEEFSSFYRSTVRKLIGFLMNHGADLPLAADIVQDVMIKAYERWADIDDPSAWAHKVASRALIRKVADIREDPVERIPEPTSLLPCPDAVAEWEVRHDMLRLLRNLPPRQRQVLAWTFAGRTPSEIAEQLGLTPEAVRASLKKARRAAAGYAKGQREGQ
ncbi:sigma-70 family RNA polymerase sigma factor [Streptomyces hiroshimensis]